MSDDVLTLTQYEDPARRCQITTVLCRKHDLELLTMLRRMGIGSISCYHAGSLSRCDRCPR